MVFGNRCLALRYIIQPSGIGINNGIRNGGSMKYGPASDIQ